MSEGTRKRRGEAVQETCLHIDPIALENGRSRDPGTSLEENGVFCFDNIVAKVYNNDLVMRHIVSFVTNISDRVNLELSSTRLHYISKTSTWRFRSGGDTLSLTFKSLDAQISVEIGDLWFALPCTTMSTRREGSTRRSTQPLKLMEALYGIAERFTMYIENVTMGGVDLEYLNKGVQNHQLIITTDLLRLINSRLKIMKSISFRRCGFDEGAVKYLTSEECFFPNRICELAVDSVWFDSDTLVPRFVSLVTSSLRVMRLKNFSVVNLGINLFDRMRKIGMVLDDLHVDLNPYSMQGMSGVSIREFLMSMSSVTCELHIGVPRRKSSSGGNLFFALQNLTSMKNITELHLLVQPSNRGESEAVICVLSGLGEISSLRKIVCGNWQNYDMSIAFSTGLKHCSSLKEVVIMNIVTTIHGEMVAVLSAIPNNIESLHLEAVVVTNSEIIDLFKKLLSLRNLSLINLRRISSSGVYRSLLLLRELKTFYCSVPINDVVLRFFTNPRSLGDLWNITIVSARGNHDHHTKMLSKCFVKVRCSVHCFNKRWCLTEAVGRRLYSN